MKSKQQHIKPYFIVITRFVPSEFQRTSRVITDCSLPTTQPNTLRCFNTERRFFPNGGLTMFRYLSCLMTAALLTLILAGCQTEPFPEPAPTASSDTAAKVLALLTVNADGTVAVTDEGKARTLLGAVWPAAKTELASLNRRITTGQISPFRSVADLARYTSTQPTYLVSPSADGEQFYTAASDPVDPKNPQCRDKCSPYSSICCCSGWWVFCWGTCGCKP